MASITQENIKTGITKVMPEWWLEYEMSGKALPNRNYIRWKGIDLKTHNLDFDLQLWIEKLVYLWSPDSVWIPFSLTISELYFMTYPISFVLLAFLLYWFFRVYLDLLCFLPNKKNYYPQIFLSIALSTSLLYKVGVLFPSNFWSFTVLIPNFSNLSYLSSSPITPYKQLLSPWC